MAIGGDGLIHLTIDGQEVAVPATKTAYDPLYKKQVEIPTTIYDAAIELEKKTGKNPIPILCHREHINPVAVCRVCTVEVGGRILAPACYLPVKGSLMGPTGPRDVSEVKTAASSERVRTVVKTLTQLLIADHAAPCEKHRLHGDCELELLAKHVGATKSPFPGSSCAKPIDDSSQVIAVDHNACILCDRCVRACNDIRDNQVIGRMGKGYLAQIAFDLNDPMGDSSCVACGECMISCPTGALVNRKSVLPIGWDKMPASVKVTADDLAKHELFREVSQPFLRFNEASVVRRHFKKGDVICREGDFGASAFLIEWGKVEIRIRAPFKHVKSRKSKNDKVNWGLFGLIRRFSTGLVQSSEDPREEEGSNRYIPVDAPIALPYENPVATLEAGDIFGEMSCMNNYPRSATVVAKEECTCLEMLRNVLYILQRNKKSRAWLEERYRSRSISNHLRSVPLFANLFTQEEAFGKFVDFLRPRVELRQCTPKEVIVRQGDPADHFYLVRVGFVKVTQQRPGGEQVLKYIGPGGYFGEIGLLSHLPELRALAPAGVRTATCTALDHVDLVQISGADFLALVERHPELRDQLVKVGVETLQANEAMRQKVESVPLGDFLEQGLANATSLLVLDLEKCTRCDECTKACADSHDGVTRLIRDGLRFDKFLVASSCRSCLDPYCMVGCPVDAIHRREGREIIIENWCIGCGNCANNCPYGNINMHGFDELWPDPADPSRKIAVKQQKATMCDLCSGLDSQPSCVYACPHDAAHRMSGKEMLKLVGAKGEGK
jgi:CRP-like cAMP-binding protein/Fe-S-cluster-containing dehydrogenase component